MLNHSLYGLDDGQSLNVRYNLKSVLDFNSVEEKEYWIKQYTEILNNTEQIFI